MTEAEGSARSAILAVAAVGAWRNGGARALGARGCGFESHRPDQPHRESGQPRWPRRCGCTGRADCAGRLHSPAFMRRVDETTVPADASMVQRLPATHSRSDLAPHGRGDANTARSDLSRACISSTGRIFGSFLAGEIGPHHGPWSLDVITPTEHDRVAMPPSRPRHPSRPRLSNLPESGYGPECLRGRARIRPYRCV